MEKWKEIEGFEGRYLISSHGNVMSLQYEGHNYAKALTPKKINGNYLSVELQGKSYLIHRLVANAFIDNSNNYNEVNHINGIKSDNNVENLEWCSHSMNMQHAYNNNLHKKYCGENNVNSKPVLQYDLKMNFIKEFVSIADANKTFNKQTSHISDCCRGKRKTAEGYVWRYKRQKRICIC